MISVIMLWLFDWSLTPVNNIIVFFTLLFISQKMDN